MADPLAVPSDAPGVVLAAVTAWRGGDSALAMAILSSLGEQIVFPLFGFYVGLLMAWEEDGGNVDEYIRRVALRIARLRVDTP